MSGIQCICRKQFPSCVYRTVPVVINTDDRGMPTAFGGPSGRLGERRAGNPVSTTDLATSVQVSVRQADESVVADVEWASAPFDLPHHAQPWRTFRRYKGRQHQSGTYRAATVRDHVIHESRLEPARLLFADFAPNIRHVVARSRISRCARSPPSSLLGR